ncbi:hypothetical protein [Agrococcus sp. KRD186]|nr:hypothetical protein [Agrococcus sp. KRD186]
MCSSVSLRILPQATDATPAARRAEVLWLALGAEVERSRHATPAPPHALR